MNAPVLKQPRHITAATLEFTFEELALVVEDGFEAGLVNGSATVAYHDDGEWFVHEIYLDGSKRIPTRDFIAAVQAKGTAVGVPSYLEKKIELEFEPPAPRPTLNHLLYLTIHEHLTEGKWRCAIQDKVNAELELFADHRLTYATAAE